MTETQTQDLTTAINTLLDVLPPECDVILKAADDGDIILSAERWRNGSGRTGKVEFCVSDGLAGSRGEQSSHDTLGDALAFFATVEEAGGYGAYLNAQRRSRVG